MSRNLFPEFKNYIRWGKEWDADYLHLSNVQEPHSAYTHIHWFEFTIMHLAPKIIDVLEGARSQIFEGNDLWYEMEPSFASGCDVIDYHIRSGTHPVDYLFTEYKKLSLWQF